MPEKKEKKPEKQTAYIGLTILFFPFHCGRHGLGKISPGSTGESLCRL